MAPPRLHFHASLREAILDGRKTATTRLRGEADANSDLEALRAGVRCSARTGAGGAADAFADLEVCRVATSRFADLDDDVARLEGCADAEALRRLIARFYPNHRARQTTAAGCPSIADACHAKPSKP